MAVLSIYPNKNIVAGRLFRGKAKLCRKNAVGERRGRSLTAEHLYVGIDHPSVSAAVGMLTKVGHVDMLGLVFVMIEDVNAL